MNLSVNGIQFLSPTHVWSKCSEFTEASKRTPPKNFRICSPAPKKKQKTTGRKAGFSLDTAVELAHEKHA